MPFHASPSNASALTFWIGGLAWPKAGAAIIMPAHNTQRMPRAGTRGIALGRRAEGPLIRRLGRVSLHLVQGIGCGSLVALRLAGLEAGLGLHGGIHLHTGHPGVLGSGGIDSPGLDAPGAPPRILSCPGGDAVDAAMLGTGGGARAVRAVLTDNGAGLGLKRGRREERGCDNSPRRYLHSAHCPTPVGGYYSLWGREGARCAVSHAASANRSPSTQALTRTIRIGSIATCSPGSRAGNPSSIRTTLA